MIQFLTKYQHPSGQKILRVTTVAHAWADPAAGPRALVPGFDQEATAALMARWAVWKSEKEEVNAIRWLDRHLIQLMVRFADYQKGSPASFQAPAEMSVYPQFMFYLRRGPLIQVFNNSPDETVFFRYVFSSTASYSLLLLLLLTYFNEKVVPVARAGVQLPRNDTAHVRQLHAGQRSGACTFVRHICDSQKRDAVGHILSHYYSLWRHDCVVAESRVSQRSGV